MELDIERLRNDLMNYFGTAMFSGFPMAVIELSKIENASDEEILEIAQNNNFDLGNYIKNDYTRVCKQLKTW